MTIRYVCDDKYYIWSMTYSNMSISSTNRTIFHLRNFRLFREQLSSSRKWVLLPVHGWYFMYQHFQTKYWMRLSMSHADEPLSLSVPVASKLHICNHWFALISVHTKRIQHLQTSETKIYIYDREPMVQNLLSSPLPQPMVPRTPNITALFHR